MSAAGATGPTSAVVVLMAKVPAPGHVKTRLCPPLTPDEAAAAATALLLDSQDAAMAAGADVWCAFHGDEARLARLLDPAVRRVRQRGTGLGERLAAAQADAFDAGYGRALLLGADCPTVDAAYLRSVLRALDEVSVVLGPAMDGGYTLLGSNAGTAALFAIQMSTDRVCAETLRLASAAGLRTDCLPPRHDIDTIDDLRAALDAGQLQHAPRTRALAARVCTVAV